MKKILKISLLLLTTIIIIIAGGALYFSKRIKPIIQEKLSEQLQVKVEVNEIKLTRLMNFPRLGIRFEKITIHESQMHYGKPALEADELSLYIDLLKLLKKEYTVDAIYISNATIRLADLEKGSNYDIFKSDTSSSEPLNFEIKDLQIVNSKVLYQHKPSTFLAHAKINDIYTNLKYVNTNTHLKIKGSLLADSIKHNTDFYLKGQEIAINTEILMTENNELLSISPSDLKVEGVELQTSGIVRMNKSTFIDIKFNNKEAPISDILTILPDYLQESFSHIKASGKANLDAYFKGHIDEKRSPSFGLDFTLDNTSLSPDNISLSLTNISASGKLLIEDLANMNTAFVQCRIKQAQTGNNSISGDLRVENFNDPLIKWAGNASLDAATISALANLEGANVQSGRIDVKGNLQLRYLTDREMVQPNSFKFIGTFAGNDLKLRINDPSINITALDFDIKANDKHMIIRSCQVKYNESSADITGVIRDADQLFNKKTKTEVSGKLLANNLNINDFFSTDTLGTGSETINKELLPFKLALQTEIKGFKYNDFIAEEVVGTLISDQKKIVLKNAKMKALEGHVDADITFTTLGNNYLLDINSRVYSINITQLFEQFNNFEQEEITSEHLSGSLSGDIIAKVMFNSNFDPLLDKLYAKSNMEILNGRLKGYEPLLALSSYVEVDDLKDVSFKSLENTIEIFDQTIFIPKMYIGNNAMNLELEGTHNFENYMNYNMSLSLGELLAKRSNWYAKKYEKNMKDNSRGGLTANIHMEGTPDDLKITYDRVTVTKVVGDELKQEKKNFLDALKGQSTPEEKPDEYYEDVWDE